MKTKILTREKRGKGEKEKNLTKIRTRKHNIPSTKFLYNDQNGPLIYALKLTEKASKYLCIESDQKGPLVYA